MQGIILYITLYAAVAAAGIIQGAGLVVLLLYGRAQGLFRAFLVVTCTDIHPTHKRRFFKALATSNGVIFPGIHQDGARVLLSHNYEAVFKVLKICHFISKFCHLDFGVKFEVCVSSGDFPGFLKINRGAFYISEKFFSKIILISTLKISRVCVLK